MELDPYVSAVVSIRRDRQPGPDEATVENPGGVGGEAAAILEGTSPSEPGLTRAVSAADVAVPVHGGAIARAKAYFTKAGFEVHAPLGATFSIGNRKSRFETFFSESLVIDEERLGGPVTTADGERELPLGPLPDEVREIVESVALPPPLDYLGDRLG